MKIQDRSEIEVDEAVEVFDYWTSIRDKKGLPQWSDIKLSDLPAAVLPRCTVVDVQTDPLDFHYRFWGSGLTPVVGRDMTGRTVRDLQPDGAMRVLFEHYRDTVQLRWATAHRVEFTIEGSMRVATYALRLPLFADDRTVDKILTIVCYLETVDHPTPLVDARSVF
ncbi:MAG: PAS domain-containing protein [Rhodospirillales bacterium]